MINKSDEAYRRLNTITNIELEKRNKTVIKNSNGDTKVGLFFE